MWGDLKSRKGVTGEEAKAELGPNQKGPRHPAEDQAVSPPFWVGNGFLSQETKATGLCAVEMWLPVIHCLEKVFSRFSNQLMTQD